MQLELEGTVCLDTVSPSAPDYGVAGEDGNESLSVLRNESRNVLRNVVPNESPTESPEDHRDEPLSEYLNEPPNDSQSDSQSESPSDGVDVQLESTECSEYVALGLYSRNLTAGN